MLTAKVLFHAWQQMLYMASETSKEHRIGPAKVKFFELNPTIILALGLESLSSQEPLLRLPVISIRLQATPFRRGWHKRRAAL